MRRLTAVPIGAWLVVELYLTLVPLLGAVPRWLFEASRLVLLFAGLVTLAWAAALAVKNRRQLHGAAFLWFGIAVSTAAVCLLRWISMTFPFFA